MNSVEDSRIGDKDIDKQDNNGKTPLMLAAYYGHAEIVSYLLANGADKSVANKKGETALSIAEKKKFVAVAAILDSQSF